MKKDEILQLISPVTKDLLPKLITSWLLVASIMVSTVSTVNLESFRESNIFLILMIILVMFAAITLVQNVFKKINIVQVLLLITVTFFSTVMIIKINSLFTILSATAIVAITMLYIRNNKTQIFVKLKYKNFIILAISVVAVILPLYISIMRVATYSAPNYDFGIFCNMFHHMKESFLPMTTCERDKLMSHFCVHFSPIYYVLLPFYFIIPSPYTLNVAQVLILFSGIIPMVMLMKHKKIDNLMTVIFSVIYVTYPAISTGCFYDIHENCFLLPLLMWVFCFYEQGKYVPFYVFCGLTLLVKEDAFIYLIVFAVYILIDRKEYKRGSIVAGVALIYFIIAAALMNKYGLGIMSDRFSNLKADGEGLFGVVKTALINPAYLFSQLFQTGELNSDKIKYFVELFFPLCFMPFTTKRTARYLLISPVLINLLTTYVYQYDISKQYSFGISAFLIYVSILNVADRDNSRTERDKNKRYYIPTTAAIMSVIICLSTTIPKAVNYSSMYKDNKAVYNRFEQVLDRIPQDASISISTFLLQKVSDRDEVYELEYHAEPDTDYMIVDERYRTEELEKEYISKYIKAGYQIVESYEGVITVYKK